MSKRKMRKQYCKMCCRMLKATEFDSRHLNYRACCMAEAFYCFCMRLESC
ncbi:MAG: hypothetical protein J5659_05120 [Clostridia bacterium]|nr:hypothetical protein [Clostridia bacterium]